jgi:hypothetical protein
MYVTLVTAATATNGAPTLATDGVDIRKGPAGEKGRGLRESDYATLLVYSTAGSGTMTATVKLWGYVPRLTRWFPLGASTTDSLRGVVNLATVIGEDGANLIEHSELVQGLSTFTRAYAEIATIGGTATAITVELARG